MSGPSPRRAPDRPPRARLRDATRSPGALRGVGTMSDDSGMMPEEYIDRPAPPFVQLKVKDLEPEHGEGFIGVGDVAVDVDRACWALLDAPVFGADFRDVAPLTLRRT